MDGSDFDDLLRSLGRCRRSLIGGALAASLGLLVRPGIDAKKKRTKRKHKKPRAKPNAFGCLDVGDPCKSADACCSGVCEGKKCRAHDLGTCDQARPGYCAEGNPLLASCDGGTGVCFRTTGASNSCINNFFCADCRRDADCEALGYPAGAVCVPITGDLACTDLCAEEEIRMACGYYSETSSLAEWQ